MWQLKTNTGLAGYLELALILTLYLSSLNSLRWECWAALWTTSVSQTNHCRESWLGSRLAAKNLRTKEGLWRGQNRRELTGLIYSPRPPHSHFHTPKSLITHVCRSDRVKRIVHVSALRASSTWCYSLQFLPAGKHFLFLTCAVFLHLFATSEIQRLRLLHNWNSWTIMSWCYGRLEQWHLDI